MSFYKSIFDLSWTNYFIIREYLVFISCLIIKVKPLEKFKLILASQSPRRKELLKKIVLDFEVLPSSIEEKIRPSLTVEENVCLLAREKTIDISEKREGVFIIGADTLVVLDGVIFGKPNDIEDARRILRFLSGKTHEVVTGVSVMAPNGKCEDDVARSMVTFKSLTEEEIVSYINTGEPMDKAGAYAIQGEGSRFVISHEGSWSNIVGLPMETLQDLLIRQGCPI